jgi:uncharacterized membrane protein (UPF0127 family)
MVTFLNPLLRPGAKGLRLQNTRNGRVVADDLVGAFDSATRNKGLLQRESLPDGTALIIAPCSAVHTFFMKFAIDIAFVSKDGRVVKVRTAVPAWRMTGSLRSFCVIELAAGSLARCETLVGDRLEIV